MYTGSPEGAMHEIIADAAKAVQAGRWVSIEQAQPNTVEFWARDFRFHMVRAAQQPEVWAEMQKAFA
eukprot:11220077-Lingulodinium_polyedra.AAC.1